MRGRSGAARWAGAALAAWLLAACAGGAPTNVASSGDDGGDGVERRVDVAAVVAATLADAGSVAYTLDDGSTLTVVEPTAGDDGCTAPDAVGCVLLANTFGGAVVWYALRDPDPVAPTRVLELPGLADMLDAGDTAVLGNGWLVPLASPTLRTCDEPAPTLRAFIDAWGADRSVARLDLVEDEIDEVVCRPVTP